MHYQGRKTLDSKLIFAPQKGGDEYSHNEGLAHNHF
jgi:hypothetical protein